MEFTSISFLVFLSTVITTNYCLHQRWRWAFLLVASYYLEDVIHLCKYKNIQLVGIVSPIYGKTDRKHDIDSIFKVNNIPFIDNTSFRLPLEPNEYFKDETHLNSRGAREYTKYVMRQISDSLNLIK